MAKKKFLYPNGLPFSQKLADNLADQVVRIKANKATMVLIDGAIGEGKTTLAVEVAEHLEGRPIVMSEQLAMGGADFAKKLKLCYQNGHGWIVYDEAGDFNKRGAVTRFNAMLNRVFETYRAFKVGVIMVMPSFNVLDNSLFEKAIPRLLLHCQDRTQTYGNFKGYSLYRMYFLREKMNKYTVKPYAYQQVEANFRGHFLDLEPKRSKELDKFSIDGKLDILELVEIQSEGLLSYKDLSIRLSRTIRWCRQKMTELKINHVKTYKKQKFFRPEVLDILADEMDKPSDAEK